MTKIKAGFLGEARVEITHNESGAVVVTDASNQEKTSFSPVDLLMAAYGGCVLGMMDMVCGRLKVDLSGAYVTVGFTMSEDSNEKRVAEIIANVYLPKGEYDRRARVTLERTAMACPVGNSLHPDIKKNINFHYGEEE